MMRGVPLPDDLEDHAYEVLLDGAPGARAAAFQALLSTHPQHRDALLRLQQALAGGEHALLDSGLAESPPPATIGPYRLVRRLGEGGFGVVWLGEQDEPIRRRVAIKLIRSGMDTGSVLRRFDAERDVLTRFDHPCIARVLDAGETVDGAPFLVTEYVDGQPLAAWVHERRLPLRARIELLAKVAEGVQHAHQRGVIHRDLKPSNVLVVEIDGVAWPKIIDFGIARAVQRGDGDATRAGSVLGTPEYMSPEQALGSSDVDVRTDVYALGVMLYELLVGDLPLPRARWRQADLAEQIEWLRHVDVARPSTRAGDATLARQLRGDLDDIVTTALTKERQRRYPSVQALIADLEAYLADRPIAAGPVTFGYQLRKFVRRHRAQVAAVAAVFVALSSGLAASLAALGRARAAEDASGRLAAELRVTLSQYDALADVVRARELQVEAAELWPAVPERLPRFDAWLRAVRQLLTGTAERERIAAIALARAGDGDAAAAFLADTLTTLTGDLQAFTRPSGLVAQVELGRTHAAAVERRTLHEPAAAWQETIEAIAQSPRYGGLRLVPQLGLLPIGADPDSGLYEFVHVQSGEVPARDADGRIVVDEAMGNVLVLLPGGEAIIGAQKEDPDAPRYDPQSSGRTGSVQRVQLAPFFLGKYEVTRAQWQRAMMAGGAFFEVGTECGQGPVTLLHPAENIAWQDAMSYCRRNDLELPTNAQWEYACRAGGDTIWSTGDEVNGLAAFANIAGREHERSDGPPGFSPEHVDGYVLTAPIGRFRANGFGLCDMHGNIAEVCADSVVDPRSAMRDGDGRRLQFDPRVISVRGGSYGAGADRARCGTWSVVPADRAAAQLGLRVARAVR